MMKVKEKETYRIYFKQQFVVDVWDKDGPDRSYVTSLFLGFCLVLESQQVQVHQNDEPLRNL